MKDMTIALEEAQRMQLALPGLALAQQLYTALVAQGQQFYLSRTLSPGSCS